MERALAVANAIITIAFEKGIPPTQLKLQKLLYFAHGWHLVLYNEPLVDENFQAYKSGPLIPSVYQVFKIYGSLGIFRPGSIRIDSLTPESEPLWETPEVVQREHVLPLVELVWDIYGRFSARALCELVQMENTPWRVIWEQNKGTRDVEIPNDMIKAYFQAVMDALIEKRESRAAGEKAQADQS